MDDRNTSAAAEQKVTAWRSMDVVTIGGESLTLAVTHLGLAALFRALEVDSLYDLYRKWDALHPETMRKTLAFFALDGKRGEKLFDAVEGVRGMEELHTKFYALVSGMTPDEMAEEMAAKKKLAALPAEVAARIVADLAAHQATKHLVASPA